MLDRDLARGNTEEALAEPVPPGEAQAPDLPETSGTTGPVRRGTRALWRLARTLIAIPGLFDRRPRGALVFRALGKLPVVGLAGGVLDERAAVRRAATANLDLGSATPPRFASARAQSMSAE